MRRASTVAWLLTFFIIFSPSHLRGAESSGLRLDRNVVPIFQAIDLTVDAGRPDYAGLVRIDLQVDRKTSSFKFHAEALALESVVLTGQTGPLPLRHKEGEAGLIHVTMAQPLSPGRYLLEIRFSNRFNRQAVSLFKVETGGEAYTFTQFEAWDARKAFPCWDEPSFKIPYQITLTLPERHLAVSNTPVEKETTAGGMKRITFAKTKPLPSYLLAFATGPFDTVPIPGLSVPGKIITVKGNGALTADAIGMTPKILSALEAYFQSPYPYEKLDLIGVPEFLTGAMENPGAVTFRESGLLLHPERSSVAQRRRLASLLAHELAHMWFGNLVTMAWWDDLWLNEAFASWMGDKIVDQLFPELKIAVTGVGSVQYAMGRDMLLAARAIRKPIDPLDNPLQSFSVLAYTKGEAILGMFEQWLGPENFRKGVLHYLAAHASGNATAEDLWRSLSKITGKEVGRWMAPFLNQPGLPLVEVTPLSDGKIRFRQRRLLYAGAAAPSPAKWNIPVVVRYPAEGRFMTERFLLTEASQIFQLKTQRTPSWIHPNVEERGYYRWTIPPEMQKAMLGTVPTALSAREQAGLLGHLPALLDAGSIRGEDYLEAIGAFGDDAPPEVVSPLIDAVDKVRSDFIGPESNNLEEPFTRYVQATVAPALQRIGLSRREGEEAFVSLLRPTLILWLGSEGKDPEAIEYGRALAASYLKDPASVDPALISTGLQLAAIEGDRALFEKYKSRFETAAMPTERGLFLSALGAFQDLEIVESALQYALEGPLRPQEILTIPQMIASEPRYQARVFDWIKEHYETIISRRPARSAIYLPFFASGCSLDRLKEAQDFFSEPSRKQPGIEAELQKLEEGVLRCVALREREGRSVSAYLKQFSKRSPRR